MKYAKQAKEAFEDELKIKKNKLPAQYKITTTDPNKINEIHKNLKNYSISLHIIAKSFKSIDKWDQAKEFITRAIHVAEDFLPTPDSEIAETMKADLDEISRHTRTLPKNRK